MIQDFRPCTERPDFRNVPAVAHPDDREKPIRLLDEIVADFVQRATMTQIPSEDPRIRSFILDRPNLHVAPEPDD